MTLSTIALSTLHLAGLRLLCIMGGCTGLAVILFGLWLSRKTSGSRKEPRPEAADRHPAREFHAAESRARQEVIRLSPDLSPTRSSDMSQQQRIAAALTRAGLANSGWSQAEVQTASAVLDPPSESAMNSDQTPNPETLPSRAGFRRRLILLIGTILALLSLMLLVTLR